MPGLHERASTSKPTAAVCGTSVSQRGITLWLSVVQEREAAERAAFESAEHRKQHIIQEERNRLLAEAGELLQYLPRAVVANEERLPPLTPAILD